MPHFIDDWRAHRYTDGNNGVAALPKKNLVVSNSYFVLDTEDGLSNEFKWHAYIKRLENLTKIFSNLMKIFFISSYS